MAAVVGPFPPRHISPSRRPHHKPSKPHPTYVAVTPPIIPNIPDPYYGHEDTAKICARFISALFSCPDTPPPPTATTTTSSSSPSTPLAQFIAYALHRTRLHSCVTFTALFLLSRLKNRFPAARGSSGHRLFISAFMIASKVVCDDTYSNKSWCVVGQGMFSLREINQMEREMCGYLEWHLNFDPQELQEFESKTRKEYGRGAAVSRPVVPPIITTPLPRISAAESRKRDISHPYPSPPSSPSPSTPSPSHSNTSSPESATCLTPPSGDGPETVVTSGNSSAVYSGSAASLSSVPSSAVIPPSSKGNIREHGFAFAAPAVW